MQRGDDRVLPAPRRGRGRDDHDRGEPRLARRVRRRPRAAAPRRGVRPRPAAARRRAPAVRDPRRDPALAPRAPDAPRRADRAVADPALLADAGAARADARGDPHARRLLRALGLGLAAGGLRLRRDPRRPLLPPVRVHLAALEPPHRRVRRPAREPRALPARDRRRDPRPLRPRLPGHVPDQRRRGRRGRLRGRGRRRGLPPARGRRRLRDQRLGGQLVRPPPDDRADVPPARLPAAARRADPRGGRRPRDRGRAPRRPG